MEKLNRRELDAVTGQEIIIELTAKEIADLDKAIKAEQDAKAAEESAKAAAKAALFERLGITAEEATLLLP
jgi:hypothetical protein